MTRISTMLRRVLPGAVLAAATAGAEQIPVMHQQGSAHGFVEVRTLEGARIAVGDLQQRAHGNRVRSHLTLRFFDGSIDDETTEYMQGTVFRFISDHHVQKGPSFPNPIDTAVDARTGMVSSTDSKGTVRSHVDLPADVYNGMASGMLMNVDPAAAETKISVVVAGPKPRIVQLSLKNAGEGSFTLGGVPRKAIDYVVHVELGGVAGVVAPLVGKQPLDYHVWILKGSDPAFIREEGQLFVGGPVWRIQQVSAVFSK